MLHSGDIDIRVVIHNRATTRGTRVGFIRVSSDRPKSICNKKHSYHSETVLAQKQFKGKTVNLEAEQ
jgi:carbamoylphosphate synthase large subunit